MTNFLFGFIVGIVATMATASYLNRGMFYEFCQSVIKNKKNGKNIAIFFMAISIPGCSYFRVKKFEGVVGGRKVKVVDPGTEEVEKLERKVRKLQKEDARETKKKNDCDIPFVCEE